LILIIDNTALISLGIEGQEKDNEMFEKPGQLLP